jgi:signal transduction histidine kinase
LLPNANLVALYREASVLQMARWATDGLNLPGAAVALLAPTVKATAERPPLVLDLGEQMPGWKLAMSFRGDDPFAAAHQHEVRTYLGAGCLAICLIGLFAFGIGRILSARLRLARMQQHLVSSVSHELRTPVASIRALVDTLLAHRVRDPGQAQDYLKLVAQESERLSHLVDSFLTFARLEQKRQPFRLEPTSLGPIVRASVRLVGARFRPPSSQLTVEIDPALPPVMANSDALRTVLLNLLDNAWKYTGNEKRVSLRVFADNGAVCMALADNGVGLTREEARHVFDRFYQADQGLARRTGGCGLGLSIVRFIVDAHRGSVVVESKVGHGSIFTVRLPAMGKPPTSD